MEQRAVRIDGPPQLALLLPRGPLRFPNARAKVGAIGPRLSLTDSALMQTEFGVSPLASSRNGHIALYAPDAGIKSLGLTSSLSYGVSQDWTTTLYGSYQRLAGAAAASPVTTLSGTPNQITFGVGFEHSFVLGH
ncbi:MipA/OmpV family protein [Xanthobacter oligotrophicus]|uniref:MipA/OmpV family protein n=1 Tax=Xanthobacter oligotrophicus TaxID=2607286 RepID=A0ABW6ZWU1_9HYPH